MRTVKYILTLFIILMAGIASATSRRESYSFMDNLTINSEFEELSFSSDNNIINSVELHFSSSRVRSRLNSSLLLPEQHLPLNLPEGFNNSFDIEHHDIIPVSQRLGVVLEIAESQADFNIRDVISHIRNNDAFRRDHLHPIIAPAKSSIYIVANKISLENAKDEPCILIQVDNDQNIKEIKKTTIKEIENIDLVEEEVAYNAISYELPTVNITTFTAINSLVSQLETRLSSLSSLSPYIAAGDNHIEKYGLWIKVHYGFMKQKKTHYVDAFKSHNQSLIIGLDTLLNENNTIGLAYGINKIFTRFDSSISREKLNLYALTLYLKSDMSLVDLFSSLTLGQLKIKNSRDLIYNDKLVTSKHTGGITLLTLGASKDYSVNETLITPSLNLSLSHLKNDAFQENGVFLSESFDRKLAIIPDIKIGRIIPIQYSSFIPSIHYGVEVCVSQKQKKPNIYIINSFDSLTPYKSKNNKFIHKLGVNFELTSQASELSIGYDFIFQKKNQFHSLLAGLRYQF